jgi:Raf kinase inhibitor-like YbhB/YbcL family protein
MVLGSSAFGDGEPIPRRYTCDGDDVSPPLSWADAPPSTASFALVVDDPDAPAGTWVHWVLFNLPGSETLELASAGEVAEAMQGHVLAEAVLMGRYARG